MATYLEHIKEATSIPISAGTTPNSTAVGNFLREGIKDVIYNVLRFSPASADLFAIESSRLRNSDNFKIESGVILEVMRERIADEWRPCRQVPVSKQYLVTDVNSFDYASEYNPVYIRDNDNTIQVFPEYTSAASDSFGYKVRYIDFNRYDSEDDTLSYYTDLETPGINGFPTMFIPHLIQYGALKSLSAYYHHILQQEEDTELASGYLATLKELKTSYDSSFLTKDLLSPKKED